MRRRKRRKAEKCHKEKYVRKKKKSEKFEKEREGKPKYVTKKNM